MGGCEGRLSGVAAVADMKDETWGWLIGIGISKKFPPHVLAFMSAAYAAAAGGTSICERTVIRRRGSQRCAKRKRLIGYEPAPLAGARTANDKNDPHSNSGRNSVSI